MSPIPGAPGARTCHAPGCTRTPRLAYRDRDGSLLARACDEHAGTAVIDWAAGTVTWPVTTIGAPEYADSDRSPTDPEDS